MEVCIPFKGLLNFSLFNSYSLGIEHHRRTNNKNNNIISAYKMEKEQYSETPKPTKEHSLSELSFCNTPEATKKCCLLPSQCLAPSRPLMINKHYMDEDIQCNESMSPSQCTPLFRHTTGKVSFYQCFLSRSSEHIIFRYHHKMFFTEKEDERDLKQKQIIFLL